MQEMKWLLQSLKSLENHVKMAHFQILPKVLDALVTVYWGMAVGGCQSWLEFVAKRILQSNKTVR